MLRLLQLGIDHPHGSMYRTTLAHHDGFEFVGGFDVDIARAGRMLSEEHIELPLFNDVDTAIAECQPDVVLITLPNDLTPAAIVTAAKHGLHIFAEKPCAISADAFAAAINAVREAEVRFVPAYLRRFSPIATAMRDLIADGILGDLVSAQITFATTNAALRNATYLAGNTIESVSAAGTAPDLDKLPTERHWLFDRERSGGGVMHWLGVHWLDLLHMVSGGEFSHAAATLATRSSAPIDVEDVASVTLEGADEMIATVTCAYVLPHGPDQTSIVIQGTNGWMRWDGSSPELDVESGNRSWAGESRRTLRFDTEPVPGYGGALGWQAFEHFRASIQERHVLPVNETDALRTLQLLDAIQRSNREGRRVAVHR